MRLTQGDLTVNELMHMLEGMGHRAPGERIWRPWAYATVSKKQYYALPLSRTEVGRARRCEECGKEPVAEKTHRRMIITLSGCSEIVFTPKTCPLLILFQCFK